MQEQLSKFRLQRLKTGISQKSNNLSKPAFKKNYSEQEQFVQHNTPFWGEKGKFPSVMLNDENLLQ